jgi:enoyl-CoA hydratase/carnithine racemase
MKPVNNDMASTVESTVMLRVINRVAIITLNRPAVLNALSHDMVRGLASFIESCGTDDNIVAVILRGAGGKGFCAGGDVREVHERANSNDDRWQAFFVDEYRLNYALHNFPKPIVALMTGITMGGGMGLAQGARLRIVTEDTKIAMPETRIGFFPDVGATYFLNTMPVEMQLYVGLTGAVLSGADALSVQLADVCVPGDWLNTYEERLFRMSTDGDLLANLRAVFEPPCNVVPHSTLSGVEHLVKRHFDGRFQIDRIIASLRQDLEREQPREARQFLQAALDSLISNSPMMLCVAREALLRGRQQTLADAFRMELGIGLRAIEEGDFREGVRAHLIDKDRRPKWQPSTIAQVRPESVQHFLSSPWRAEYHPLADLGTRDESAKAKRTVTKHVHGIF